MDADTFYVCLFLWWGCCYLYISYLVIPSHVHWNNPIKQSRFVVLSALAVSFLSFIGHSYVYIQEYEAKNNIEFKSISHFFSYLTNPQSKPIFEADYFLMFPVIVGISIIPLIRHLYLIWWISRHPHYSILTFRGAPDMPPRNLFILTIDNKQFCAGYILSYYKYLVVSGKHKYIFWVGTPHGKGSYRHLFDQEMELQLSAGHQYVVEEDTLVDELHVYDSCSAPKTDNESKETIKKNRLCTLIIFGLLTYGCYPFWLQ